jgi:hypothetical protein
MLSIIIYRLFRFIKSKNIFIERAYTIINQLHSKKLERNLLIKIDVKMTISIFYK